MYNTVCYGVPYKPIFGYGLSIFAYDVVHVYGPVQKITKLVQTALVNEAINYFTNSALCKDCY